MGITDGTVFAWINWWTALISVATSLYLLPMVPTVLGNIDDTIKNLIVLKETAETSNRQMLTFMSFLCHEIRTPLFAVTSNLEFLADEPLSSQQQVCVSALDQSAKLMMRLVNDVLDINRLENGGLHIEHVEFDLHEQLQHLQETALTNVRQRHQGNVVFSSTIAADVPRLVRGDSTRLLQIVYNLLTNAIKFTHEGMVRFNVSVDDDEAVNGDWYLPEGHTRGGALQLMSFGKLESNSDCDALLDKAETGQKLKKTGGYCLVRIQVEDTGSGIESNRLQDIFKPFTQAKLSDYRKYGGTGLGLSIVSQLLKVMGGTIRVESKEGKGSLFTVVLPMELADAHVKSESKFHAKQMPVPMELTTTWAGLTGVGVAPTVPPVGHPDHAVDRANLKFKLPANDFVVLVVDDNAINVKILCRMLDRFDIEHKSASNGQEAVDQVLNSRNVTHNPKHIRFGLVLMDLCMPVMGGCEAIRTLRRRNVDVPVIALTANALDDSRDEAMVAGATEFATKPIGRDALFDKVAHYLLKPL